jgi:hypothetical protein
MTLYILDTDLLSLYQRNHPQVCARIRHPPLAIASSGIALCRWLCEGVKQGCDADRSSNFGFWQSLV